MGGPEAQPRTPAQIFEELGFTPTSRFSGADRYEIEAGQPLEGHVFSGRLTDGSRVVVKTDNFNGGSAEAEAQLTEELRGMLAISRYWRVHRLLANGADYNVYRLVAGEPFAKGLSWEIGHMTTTIHSLEEMEELLNQTKPTPENEAFGRRWWREHAGSLDSKWMAPPLAQGLLDPTEAKQITGYLAEQAPTLDRVSRIYRDPNGGHFFSISDGRTELVDVDISYRPINYMKMRYFAWAVLAMPEEVWNRDNMNVPEWVDEIRRLSNLSEETQPTFVVSLVGTLWDVAREIKDLDPKSAKASQLRLRAMEIKDIIKAVIQRNGKTQR